VADLQGLAATAKSEKPIVVIAEFEARIESVCKAVRELRQDTETRHIPVLVYGGGDDPDALEAATSAGITLVAGAGEVLDQLPELLEQVLRVD
jgi:CheY-like chemotaxis protein